MTTNDEGQETNDLTREQMVNQLRSWGVSIPDTWNDERVTILYAEISAAPPPPPMEWMPGSPRG